MCVIIIAYKNLWIFGFRILDFFGYSPQLCSARWTAIWISQKMWSISQIKHFSNGAILKSNISQMKQFSNGAFWGRHPMPYFKIPRTEKYGMRCARGEREFLFPDIPKNGGLWFPFPNFGNGFFHSLPVPEFREWIFFIPFPFPNFGNGFFSFPSRSRISGMDFFHSLPVPELTLSKSGIKRENGRF